MAKEGAMSMETNKQRKLGGTLMQRQREGDEEGQCVTKKEGTGGSHPQGVEEALEGGNGTRSKGKGGNSQKRVQRIGSTKQ